MYFSLYLEEKADRLTDWLNNELINYKGDFRTAPATPGLLIIGQCPPFSRMTLMTFIVVVEIEQTNVRWQVTQ